MKIRGKKCKINKHEINERGANVVKLINKIHEGKFLQEIKETVERSHGETLYVLKPK
jgi:hypothetical protein